jgi:hypothetical protein
MNSAGSPFGGLVSACQNLVWTEKRALRAQVHLAQPVCSEDENTQLDSCKTRSQVQPSLVHSISGYRVSWKSGQGRTRETRLARFSWIVRCFVGPD